MTCLWGLSWYILISSRTTRFSFSNFSSLKVGFIKISDRISIPLNKCSEGSLNQNAVTSFAVKAFKMPPFFSISLEISSWERVFVPVNTRCSIKWAIPFTSEVSWEPANGFAIPNETNGKSRYSWITVIPFFSLRF